MGLRQVIEFLRAMEKDPVILVNSEHVSDGLRGLAEELGVDLLDDPRVPMNRLSAVDRVEAEAELEELDGMEVEEGDA